MTQPNQYEANFKLSRDQLSKPNAGGFSTDAYNRIVEIAENPLLVRQAFEQARGPLSFRGQTLLKNRQKGDVMFESQGNFYFDSLNPELYQQGLNVFSQASTGSTAEIPQVPAGTVITQESIPDASNFLNEYVLAQAIENRNRPSNSLATSFRKAIEKNIREGGNYEYPKQELY